MNMMDTNRSWYPGSGERGPNTIRADLDIDLESRSVYTAEQADKLRVMDFGKILQIIGCCREEEQHIDESSHVEKVPHFEKVHPHVSGLKHAVVPPAVDEILHQV